MSAACTKVVAVADIILSLFLNASFAQLLWSLIHKKMIICFLKQLVLCNLLTDG